MRNSKWYNVSICLKCKKPLKGFEIYNSNGVCPNCGHVSDGPVCNVTKLSIRKIKHYKRWQIFNRKTSYEGANEISIKWLQQNYPQFNK